MQGEQIATYEMKTIQLRIFSYEDRNIKGVISHVCLDKDIAFSNFCQMVFAVEQILDDIKYPQRSFDIRGFGGRGGKKMKQRLTLPAAGGEEKVTATFALCVMFRQNASWQGSLVWTDDKSEVQFRSVLELMWLLDSVLG